MAIDYESFLNGGGSSEEESTGPVDYGSFLNGGGTEDSGSIWDRPASSGEPKEKGLLDTLIFDPAQRGFNRFQQGADYLLGDSAGVAENERDIRGLGESERTAQLQKDVAESEGWGGAALAFAKNPGAVVELTVESLAQYAPTIAASWAGGAALGTVAGPAGTVAGMVGGTALGSFQTEYTSTILDGGRAAGYDMGDQSQVEEFFANTELMATLKDKAFKKGVPVAAFDALSAGIGGKLYKPVASVLTGAERRAAVEAGKATYSTAGRVAGATTEIASQGALGGLGEVAGALNSGQEVNRFDVLAEVAGELLPGGIESIGGHALPQMAKDKPGSAPADPNGNIEQNVSSQIRSAVTSPFHDSVVTQMQTAREQAAAAGGDTLAQEAAATAAFGKAWDTAPGKEQVEATVNSLAQPIIEGVNLRMKREEESRASVEALASDAEPEIAWRPRPVTLSDGKPAEVNADPETVDPAPVSGNTREGIMQRLQGSALGPHLDTLHRAGALNIVQSEAELPPEIQHAAHSANSEGENGSIQGVTYKGKIWLVADEIASGNEYGVLIHEGKHYSLERPESSGTLRQVNNEFARLYQSGDPHAVRAIERMEEAGITNPTTAKSESVAYLVEEVINNPQGASDSAKLTVSRVIRDVKLWFSQTKMGQLLAAHNIHFKLSAHDIVEIVRRGMIKTAQSNPGAVSGPASFSRAQHGTPEFKKFYGESKVVDDKGEPRRLYTGTSKDVDFKSFRIPKNGAWFTEDPASASQYSLENDSMDTKHDPKPGDYWNMTKVNTASRVMPVYANISNPKVYEDAKDFNDAIFKAGRENYKKGQGIVFEQLRAEGYDGIRLGASDGKAVWVAIKDTNQIKSATGNRGTFDAAKKDMSFSRKGAERVKTKRKDADSVKGKTLEETLARIPESIRVVSKDPRKTTSGKGFFTFDLDEKGVGYLPLAKSEAMADAALKKAMKDAISESSLPADEASHITTPSAKTLDKAFRLANGARYWYETSAEGFTTRFFNFKSDLTERLIDVVAASSGNKPPYDNVKDAIATLSQDARGEPITVGFRDPSSVSRSLSSDAIDTHKFGNFAGTMQLVAGLRDMKPLPTIDLQMADFFGMPHALVAGDPRMYETLALFLIKVRDLQNSALPKGAQPYESWQIQALTWVMNRGTADPDAYSEVLPRIIARLHEAGIPLEKGEKITMETLMDPRTAALLAPTSRSVGEARTNTAEVFPTLSKIGEKAVEAYHKLDTIDTPWAKIAKKKFEAIQRRAMKDVGTRSKVAGQKVKDASVISDIISVALDKTVDVTRIGFTGKGTFEGEVSPNMRVPLTVRGQVEGVQSNIVLDEEQRKYVLAMMGKYFQQKASAASELHSVPLGKHDTFSIFVQRYDREDIADSTLLELSKELGYPLNYTAAPNGWVIDINVGGMPSPPAVEMVAAAVEKVLGTDSVHLIPRSYESDYLEQKQYGKIIQIFERKAGIDSDPGASGSLRSRQRFERVVSAKSKLEGIAGDQRKALKQWTREVDQRLAKHQPAEPVEAGPQFSRGAAGRVGSARADLGVSSESTPSYGEPRSGAVTRLGIHFSKEPRAALDSRKYGSGLTGAEAKRLRWAPDARLKSRTYFYVAEGTSIVPEVGTGQHAHRVSLTNLYDLKSDSLGLRSANSMDPNAMESAILDAGFDGYVADGAFISKLDESRFGVAVVLGERSIPVEQVGDRAQPRFSRRVARSETLSKLESTEGEVEDLRRRMAVSQRQQRVPEVQEAADRYASGEITNDAYREAVSKHQPIVPIHTVPEIPSLKRVVAALSQNKVETGVVGLTTEIEEGTSVGLRLDIPAYEGFDTWVVSVHDGEKTGGNAIGYAQTGYARGVDFRTSPKAALNIASGRSDKSTIARMHGSWIKHDPAGLRDRAVGLMNDPDWIQVGMNPFRHSYFYDKADGSPVATAEEVIQIGALVLAKNARKVGFNDPMFSTLKNDPDGPKFSFAGRRARNADLDAMSDAVEMQKKGEDQFNIQNETGWFPGTYDRKMRFEFSDADARMIRELKDLPESPLFGEATVMRLEDVLQHDQLYDAYPEARDIEFVVRKGLMDMGTLQGWFNGDNRMGLTPYCKNPIGTLVHEIQHWIQEKEGFAVGGNESSAIEGLSQTQREDLAEELISDKEEEMKVLSKSTEELQRLIDNPEIYRAYVDSQKAQREMRDLHTNEASHPDRKFATNMASIQRREFLKDFYGVDSYFALNAAQQRAFNALSSPSFSSTSLTSEVSAAQSSIVKAQQAIAGLKSGDLEALKKAAAGTQSAFRAYQSIAGEIEARNTTHRREFGDKERKDVRPWHTVESNFPVEDAIVVFGASGSNEISFSRAPKRLPVPGQGSVQAARPAGAVVAPRKLKIHEKIDNAISSPLTGILDEFEYRAKRGLLHGKLEETDTISRMMFDVFNHGSAQDKVEAYKYLTTKHADPASITDPEMRALAVDTKAAFEQLGQKAMALGTLDGRSFAKYGGAYLPRLYLRHLMPDADRSKIAGGGQPSFAWAKERKDIDVYTRDFLLGEIKDAGYLAAKGFAAESRDLHMLDFLEAISHNPNWVLQNEFIYYQLQSGRVIRTTIVGLDNRASELEAMAVNMPAAEAAVTLAEASAMRADVSGHRQLIADHQDGVDQSKFKRIPNSKKYGNLAGMFVLKEIHNDLINVGAAAGAEQSWLQATTQKGVSLWKFGKVVASPSAQVRNFVSNGVLLHLSGVPFLRVPQRCAQAFLAMTGRGRYGVYRKLASKHGLMHTTFKLQELPKFDTEMLEMMASNGQITGGAKVGNLLKRIAGKIYNGLGGAYQWSESFWKVAAMIDGMERQGMSEEAAAQFANKALFDYSDVRAGLNTIRRGAFGAPFATFQVKAASRMAEVLSSPTKAAALLPYAFMLYGLQAAVAESLDVDSDDLDRIKKALPEWLRDRGHTLILPWKDSNGNWQVADISYYLPWVQLVSAGNSLVHGDLIGFTRETGLLGGPVLGAAAAIMTNVNSFTKRPIADPSDPPAAQLASWMGYMWNLAMPAPLTETGIGGKIIEAAGGTLNKYGEPATTGTQAALRAVGLNLYAVDPVRSRSENLKWMKYEISKVKSRMNKQLKDRNLDWDERKAVRAKYTSEMSRRRDQMREYARESMVPEKLR